ncbi:hypothetical protein B0H13DRAFT_2354452 [Mycena leptocephala]|nr:hypothetical protein B0H13DRAFT_2387249 [Mycena leptocephala]KAJ7862836.1 hypothetical protein B0H13DRAFT_2354452 [Mycena leptocephala]
MKVRHQKCGRGMGLGTRPASAILSAGSWQSGATAMARVPPPARVRVVAIGTDSNSNSRRASRRWSHAFRPSTPVPESALDVPVDAASPGDEHNEEEVDRVHVEVQQPPHDSVPRTRTRKAESEDADMTRTCSSACATAPDADAAAHFLPQIP